MRCRAPRTRSNLDPAVERNSQAGWTTHNAARKTPAAKRGAAEHDAGAASVLHHPALHPLDIDRRGRPRTSERREEPGSATMNPSQRTARVRHHQRDEAQRERAYCEHARARLLRVKSSAPARRAAQGPWRRRGCSGGKRSSAGTTLATTLARPTSRAPPSSMPGRRHRGGRTP